MVIGGVVAFLIGPIIRKLHAGLRLRPALAVLLTYLLVVLPIALIPLLIIPSIVTSLRTILLVNWAS